MANIIIRRRNEENSVNCVRFMKEKGHIQIKKLCDKYDRQYTKVIEYKFNDYYDSVENEELFENKIKNKLHSNLIVFAYGQTGTGKTHTIFGTKKIDGLLDLTCEYLLTQCEGYYLSAYEVYRNEVYDLFNKREKLRFFGHNLYLKNKTKILIKDHRNYRYYIKMLLKIRTIGSTLLNNMSSRSHCVIEITTPDVQIVYIDLAGNEKTRYSNDRCYGDRRETAYINKDLFAIKEVIRGKSKSKNIGYRYSKIACIINGVLNSRKNSYMICTIHQGEYFVKETIDSLNYCSLINENKRFLLPDIHKKTKKQQRVKLPSLKKKIRKRKRKRKRWIDVKRYENYIKEEKKLHQIECDICEKCRKNPFTETTYIKIINILEKHIDNTNELLGYIRKNIKKI